MEKLIWFCLTLIPFIIFYGEHTNKVIGQEIKNKSNYLLKPKTNHGNKEGKTFRFGSTSQLLMSGAPGGGVVKREEDDDVDDIVEDIVTLIANNIPQSG